MAGLKCKIRSEGEFFVSSFQVRTDLALEARESVQDGGGEIHGVIFEEEELEETGIHITRVIIETKNGAKAMGKPMGTYITLEAPALAEADEGYHREVSEELARQLLQLHPEPLLQLRSYILLQPDVD